MPSVRPVFLTTLLVVLMAVLTSSGRTTRWPKPQSTKKPPRGSNGGGGGGGFVQTTTMTTSPSSMHTDETTEIMMDTYSLAPTDSTTYSSDAYPTDFHTDAVAPPGNTHGNYTLDYNECFFNFCECCPPERGPVGPMGESGPPGPPGERGPLGKMDYHFQENYFLEVKICPFSYCFLFDRVARREGRNRAQRTSRTRRTTWSQWTEWRHRYNGA